MSRLINQSISTHPFKLNVIKQNKISSDWMLDFTIFFVPNKEGGNLGGLMSNLCVLEPNYHPTYTMVIRKVKIIFLPVCVCVKWLKQRAPCLKRCVCVCVCWLWLVWEIDWGHHLHSWTNQLKSFDKVRFDWLTIQPEKSLVSKKKEKKEEKFDVEEVHTSSKWMKCITRRRQFRQILREIFQIKREEVLGRCSVEGVYWNEESKTQLICVCVQATTKHSSVWLSEKIYLVGCVCVCRWTKSLKRCGFDKRKVERRIEGRGGGRGSRWLKKEKGRRRICHQLQSMMIDDLTSIVVAC